MAKNESKTEQRSGRIVGRRYRYTEDYKVLPALGGPGGRGKRVIYTSHHPCWDAKNRHNLPEEMELAYASIAPIFETVKTVLRR